MRRTLIVTAALAVVGLAAQPASAQYPRVAASSPATGERYHVEVSGGFWNPSPAILISSESLGLVGSEIDGVTDLGFAKTRVKEFRVVLRPTTKHKFYFDYLPIQYSAEGILRRTIDFNGIRFKVGLPVNSSLAWKTYEVGYEYDFLYRDRWFAGFVLDAKYTQAEATIQSPIDSEWSRAQAPIPGIGGIVRVYVMPNISVTGKVTGFKLPEGVDQQKRYQGKLVDIDIYGTVNFTNNFGAQLGYRSYDASYRNKLDTASMTLRGLYFAGVARY